MLTMEEIERFDGWRRSANMTADPCVSLPKIVEVNGKGQVGRRLDGPRQSLSGAPVR
jgi:hypothetical protein